MGISVIIMITFPAIVILMEIEMEKKSFQNIRCVSVDVSQTTLHASFKLIGIDNGYICMVVFLFVLLRELYLQEGACVHITGQLFLCT